MFGISEFFMTDEQRAWQRRAQQEARERRCALAVPWSDDIKWARELNIKGDTFKPRDLFDGEVSTTTVVDPNKIPEDRRIVSPGGEWLYALKVLPHAAVLHTMHGNRRGSVMFAGSVTVPVLHERTSNNTRWNENPMMSITPMEIITLRPGTRLARGHVAIAGLGLGHQLIEVSRRKQVKKLTLIEKSQDLVDFVLPRVRKHLARELDEVIVGSVYDELPKLVADVALVDVFPSYGGNAFQRNKLRESAFGVKKIWAWGA